MYNLAPGKGVIIGDSVAIAEPFFSTINLDIKDQVSAHKNKIEKAFSLKSFIIKEKSGILSFEWFLRIAH